MVVASRLGKKVHRQLLQLQVPARQPQIRLLCGRIRVVRLAFLSPMLRAMPKKTMKKRPRRAGQAQLQVAVAPQGGVAASKRREAAVARLGELLRRPALHHRLLSDRELSLPRDTVVVLAHKARQVIGPVKTPMRQTAQTTTPHTAGTGSWGRTCGS